MEFKNSSKIQQKHSSKTFFKEIHQNKNVKTVRWKSILTRNNWKETRGNKINQKKISKKNLFNQTNKTPKHVGF